MYRFVGPICENENKLICTIPSFQEPQFDQFSNIIIPRSTCTPEQITQRTSIPQRTPQQLPYKTFTMEQTPKFGENLNYNSYKIPTKLNPQKIGNF